MPPRQFIETVSTFILSCRIRIITHENTVIIIFFAQINIYKTLCDEQAHQCLDTIHGAFPE